MAFAGKALHKAIYDRLVAVSDVTNLLADGDDSVFDYVKQDAAFPYIVIGEFTFVNSGDKIKTGQEATCVIHVFGKGRGRSEVAGIMQEVVEALDRQESSLTATGFQIVFCNFEFSDIVIDGEDATNFYPHGVLRFRINIREA